jgi:hypothetical protein
MIRGLGAAGAWFLSGLLLYSAVDKIVHWTLFEKALSLYRVVPALLLPAASYAVPAVEIGVAVAVAVPALRTRGLHLAAWLLTAFTFMVGYATIVVPGVPCGCSFSLGPSRATIGHVALNLMLTGLAWALASGRGGGPVDPPQGKVV